MQYHKFAPPPHLQHIVECFWSLESDRNEIAPTDYFLMADSCAEIVFQYNEGFKNYASQSARVRFQHSIHAKFHVSNKLGFFGVRLYPHAVNQLLGAPVSDLTNEVADFTSFFKQEGADLADKVYNAGTSEKRIVLISDFLSRAASKHKVDPMRYFVDQVIYQAGCIDISKIHQESGLSVKQFERRFKATAGFSPKYFARIVRFQSIKDNYASGRNRSMTNIAYDGHYYDQSHFNKEFKEFSGVQPLKYFKAVNQAISSESIAAPVAQVSPTSRFDGYLPCGLFV